MLTPRPELEFSCLAAARVLVLSGLFWVELRTRAAGEFRLVPGFCLTEEFVLFLLLLTVAAFLSALFRWVTAELFLGLAETLTAERFSELFCVLVRTLLAVDVLAALVLPFAEFLYEVEFLPEFLRA